MRLLEQPRRALLPAAGAAALLLGRWAWNARLLRLLDGRVVLITGGSRGLGLALAREFARHGARVAICARDREELAAASEDLRTRGAEVLAIECDVTDAGAVDRMIGHVAARFGAVDVLVNNAGVITVGPVTSQRREDFEAAMNVMFWGVVNATFAVLPSMRERRDGTIVNITSIGGKIAFPHMLPYTAAKFAAVGFSEGLHAEASRSGVRVVTVVPGFMRTGSHVNATFKGDARAQYSWFVLGPATPLTSIAAWRAARRIVTAAVRGKRELTITPPAHLAARAAGLAPGLVSAVASVIGRLLPGRDATDTTGHAGYESRTALSESPLTALGRMAEHRYNQDVHHNGHQKANR